MVRDFRDLEVWKRGKEIALSVYQATNQFPRAEQFGLSSQMRRAAVSVPANISEGFNRHYTKEFRRFLGIALGSCGELETEAEIAAALGYLNRIDASQLLAEISIEAKMLRSLISKLK